MVRPFKLKEKSQMELFSVDFVAEDQAGPKELCGAVDLFNRYKLWPHHETFCKRLLPSALSETPYLRNVVGNKKIRKGEGMELDQLLCEASSKGSRRQNLQPFQLDILREAFQISEITGSDRSLVESGNHLSPPCKNEGRHKRRKDWRREKKKDLKKHKQQQENAGMLKENGHDKFLIQAYHPYQLLKQKNNGLA